MMRLARRTILLVPFYLLTSASTAYAECAWVMWFKGYPETQDPRRVQVRWDITEHTFESKRECDERARQETRRWIDLVRTAPKDFMTGSYVCYPATVDPRGPKGK